MKDFDDATGKLVNVPSPPKAPGSIDPKGPSVLTNPLGLAPAGSKPGRISAVDGFRTAFAGVSVYGLLDAATKLWVFAAGHPTFLGPHASEIITAVNTTIAATVAISHAIHAFAGDSKPRANPPAP